MFQFGGAAFPIVAVCAAHVRAMPIPARDKPAHLPFVKRRQHRHRREIARCQLPLLLLILIRPARDENAALREMRGKLFDRSQNLRAAFVRLRHFVKAVKQHQAARRVEPLSQKRRVAAQGIFSERLIEIGEQMRGLARRVRLRRQGFRGHVAQRENNRQQRAMLLPVMLLPWLRRLFRLAVVIWERLAQAVKIGARLS